MSNLLPNLINNKSTHGREEKYDTVDVNLDAILKSWRMSLFSFEWLTPDGDIRTPDQLPEAEREKYNDTLAKYEDKEELERPILGIGVMDNIEIGSRREVLLTLATQGIKTLSVHIPWSNRDDFISYL